MSPVRLAVTGATGRMGRAVIDAAIDRGHDVVLAVNRSPDRGSIQDVEITDSADVETRLEDRPVDVIVDFTGPESSVRYAEMAADARIPIVVGTTGFDEGQSDRLAAAATRTPLLRAANFSRGIYALQRAVEVAARALPGYNIEVTETHHNAKLDAPSGTAKELLALIDRIRGESEPVHGREGHAPRQDPEVGVHARRAGDITGEHEVLLAANRETLELTHRASDRGVFAAGALDAAEWLVDQDPGYYEFAAVIEDS